MPDRAQDDTDVRSTRIGPIMTTIRVTRRPRTSRPEGGIAATRSSDAPPDGVDGTASRLGPTGSPAPRPHAAAARPDSADTAVRDPEGGHLQR